MPKFGKKSLERLEECHEDLQLLMNELIKVMDVTILCGYRSKEEQTQAFINGHSKLQFPNSKHNKKPSLAVDVAPYPVNFKDLKPFIDMCKLIEEIADRMGIKIILGRDFSFRDFPHCELATQKDIDSGYYRETLKKRKKV